MTTDPEAADRSLQALKLTKKLQGCDRQLALLLTQTADSLQSLLDRSDEASRQAAQGDDTAATTTSLTDFEDVAQDWLASVYDIQLTLRRAIRFLVRSSHPPVMTSAHSFVPGGGVSAAEAGTAGFRQREGQQGQGQASTESMASSEDAELSMSALRLKRDAWKDLVDVLQAMQALQGTTMPDHSQDGLVQPP